MSINWAAEWLADYNHIAVIVTVTGALISLIRAAGPYAVQIFALRGSKPEDKPHIIRALAELAGKSQKPASPSDEQSQRQAPETGTGLNSPYEGTRPSTETTPLPWSRRLLRLWRW